MSTDAVSTDAAETVMSGAALAQCRQFCWTPDGSREPTLRDIDLRIDAGERVLLAGPSGSGKSTLLRALAGVLHVGAGGEGSGEVLLRGRPAAEAGASIGLLLQDPRDARVAQSVGRDVAFGCENLGMPRGRIGAAVDAALRAVRFPYGPGHDSDAVSGGEAQRLALAGVVAPRPDLLLLDEPTSMLDEISAKAVRESVVEAIEGSQIALVVVEHRLRDWLPLVDRMIVLDAHGRVVADGPVEQTLQDHREPLVRAGVWVPGVPDPEPLAIPAGLLPPVRRPRATLSGDMQSSHTESGPRVFPAGGAGGPGSSGGGPLLRARQLRLEARPALRFTGVRRPRPSAVALDGVDAAVRAGRLLAVRGGSGAGKSSLVAALCGLVPPTSGAVQAETELAADGERRPHRWRSRDLAARIGWVPQDAAANVVGATVRECLLATVHALGGGAERADGRTQSVAEGGTAADPESRAEALAHLLGLTHLLHRHPHQLSGGEARRLAVASGLLHSPPVLCLDEPTVGQDRHTWAAVAGLVLAAREAGAGVVVSTHDDALAALADDHLLLRDGRVLR
ncbi:energy-coupling factor transport system ATP-binding protein [Kineosphaera limosa]|uniref:ATP-binding cassette domain-containing protein n=1 Tax=Kineosphaera limosa TaxID=111564 RepID=UPI00031E2C6D|nr:energy-coupling factor transport system ATP-binding protein [Kineosphaera limosa]